MNQQTCKVCGRSDKFNFHVPDDLWARVVPEEFRQRVVCLSCFDGFAATRDVDYGYDVRTLWFVGDAVTIKFESAWSRR